MNFCPECGTKLGEWEVSQNRCGYGHVLKPEVTSAPQGYGNQMKEERQVIDVPTTALAPAQTTAVAEHKDRKLPETPEEREDAYISAMRRMAAIFETFGFHVMNNEMESFTVCKGPLTLDAKIVENRNNVAYVTSSPSYNPEKAGKKGSNAVIQKGRKMFQSRDLLRVTVSGNQSIPIFVELRQNIKDPELHICKAVMFILETALSRDSSLHHALRSVEHLRGVPAEWLPKPENLGDFPELADLVDVTNQLPEPAS